MAISVLPKHYTMPMAPRKQRPTIRIGSLSFPTIVAAQTYTRDCLVKLGTVKVQQSHPRFPFFIDLIHNHPRYHTMFSLPVDSFEIVRNKLNPKGLALFVNFSDGSRDDFSWRVCCGAKSPNNLRNAMRQAVRPSIQNFRDTAPQICTQCSSTTNLHVDHESPQFEDLCKSFEVTHVMPTSFEDHPSHHMAVFREQDADLAATWIRYHDSTAKLRMLCATCNMTRGKGGSV